MDQMTTQVVFPGKVPGNNGKDGLLRMHHKKKTSLMQTLIWTVKAATRHRHSGPVRLELVRHSTGPPMDYDNLVSTGKLLVDAIVKAGVLPDDNPEVIIERHYSQTKALNSKSQMTVIRLIAMPK